MLVANVMHMVVFMVRRERYIVQIVRLVFAQGFATVPQYLLHLRHEREPCLNERES